jgi:predicted  nucleic acid-binding Zn-ribbon protein
MKRKFISAMLFGALLIAPATTFVGCADYDDDIENLQGQITNNATTLDQLTKEKIQNVETEIESLKAANKQLQEALDKAKSEGTDADAATLAAAQKLVEDAQAQLQAALDAVNGDITGINGKISDLDARLLAQDGRLKSVESLLAADGKLTLAINDAQALAEKAYNLAEQTAATAEANKQAIKDAADNLKTIKESLEGQINTLGEKVNDLSTKLAKQNADITAQINSLKSQLDDAKNGISANGNKITENKQKIDEIVNQLTRLQNQIAKNKLAVETLESNYLTKVNKIVEEQGGLKTSIDGLKNANEAIEGRLTNAESRLDGIDELINSLAKSSDVTKDINKLREEIEAKIGKLNEEGKDDTVASLIAGINSSITSIQGDIERIDGEITNINGLIDVLFTDLSNLITGLIVQDYSDFNAVFAQVTKYSVTPNETGKTYYVNNATEQEAYFPYKGATGGDQRHINNYTVQQYCGDVYATINPNTVSFEGQTLALLNSQDRANPEYKLTKAVVSNKLITRAAAKNGLYKFSVYNENQNVGFLPEHVGDGKDAVYALAATNQGLKGKDNKDIKDRRVYSKYELKFKPTNITSYNRAVLSVRPISAGTLQPEAVEASVDKFCFEKLTGCQFNLVANQKVYAKYIECVGAKSASGQEDANEKTNMNKNAGFKTTLKEASINKATSGASVSINELFNTITVNNAKNGYTYTYDYYTWDYNGAITKHQFKVIYTEAMYNENAISYEHTPTSASDQTTPGTSTAFSHTLSMTSKNNVWKDNVKTIQVVGSDIPNMTVYFNKADGAVVETLNVLNGSSAKTSTLTTSELNNIKNLSFKYNPTTVAPGDYKFTVKFYDRNGNVVTSVDVKVTIKVPTTLADKIERIHRVFAGDDVILYAANNGTNAYANMSSAFVNIGQNLTASSGTGRIFFADALSNYPTTPANENTQYKPIVANNAACYTHNGNIFFDNQFVVPYVSVKNEHIYNLTVGAKYYDLKNYWTPQAKEGTRFNVKVVSPIYHAINFEQRPIELSYPQVLTLGDNTFSATNPADHSKTITYLGTNRDALIASTKIEVSAADNILEVTKTVNNSFELKLKGTAGVADGQDFKLNFVVTDVFGKEKSYPITVTFKKNTRPEINHRR